MKKIWIEESEEVAPIGDSLFMLPFFKYWVDRDGSVEYGTKLNPWVKNALPKEFIFNPSISKDTSDYIVNTFEAWKYVVRHGNSVMHVINGVSHQSGLHEELPLTFPFKKETIYGICDIVIAPFGSKAATDIDHRVWQIEKWEALLDQLPSGYKITVIGTDKDDYSWCEHFCEVISGAPLTYIAGLLTQCKMFVSIDSGPANLATLLGIKNHVLLYPHNCQITANPYATKVRVSNVWPFIVNIPVGPVIEMCLKCLGDSNAR